MLRRYLLMGIGLLWNSTTTSKAQRRPKPPRSRPTSRNTYFFTERRFESLSMRVEISGTDGRIEQVSIRLWQKPDAQAVTVIEALRDHAKLTNPELQAVERMLGDQPLIRIVSVPHLTGTLNIKTGWWLIINGNLALGPHANAEHMVIRPGDVLMLIWDEKTDVEIV